MKKDESEVRLLVVTHRDCLKHDPGEGHAERPERLAAVTGALENDAELAAVTRNLGAREAGEDELAFLHTSEHISWVKNQCETAPSVLDGGDTPVVRDSYRASTLACGAVLDAIDAVAEGPVGSAFCAVRPPGHHAEIEASMGFCLFNNVAVGARYAQRRGMARVAIVDFDVHHGNGTEHAFYSDAEVLYISLHQYPHYPGTGSSLDVGDGAGAGRNINLPFPPGSGAEEYRIAVESTVIPALVEFKPQLTMISAGFDAHRADPLSEILLAERDYYDMTRDIVSATAPFTGGRTVSALEGGYNLESLAASSRAHARALAGMEF
jgi:acetoin utilization deacetylase AcuC-like enzyme